MIKYKRYERYKDSGVEWIGEIPEHWELRKIKHIGMLSAGGVNKKIEEGEELFKSVHYMDVYRNSGKAIGNDDDYLVVSATQSQAKNCTLRKGDVLFTSSSETPDDIGHAVVISEDLEQTLYGYHLIRLRLDRDIPADYSYRKYMFNNHYIRSYFSSRTQGITRYGLKYDDYKEAVVFIPPISEQKTIANFLDQKTAEIDGLIADKEKLIELLQEKRQAIITEAVTKGLNPNVRMKDSGIEWIGEISEHWNLRRIKYLANIRNIKASDSDIDKTYIGLENIESKTGKLLINGDDEQRLIGETANIFKKGDVLFGKLRPYLAKCIIADFDGRCTSELLVLKTTSHILPEYLRFLMLSHKFIDVVNSSTYGAKMPRVSWEFIGNLKIPLPSIKEQEEIIEYLFKLTGKIDDLITDINTQINKLKEYRQSLIFEAVTGKIDVRDYIAYY